MSFDLSALRRTRWYEFAVRSLFGGAMTVVAGLIADKFGPAVGGLFLAFPAIFPASATLVEKHEREKKKQAGIQRTKRGRLAAALDANGAVSGALALAGFALTVWLLLPQLNGPLVLLLASFVWSVVAIAVWKIRKRKRT